MGAVLAVAAGVFSIIKSIGDAQKDAQRRLAEAQAAAAKAEGEARERLQALEAEIERQKAAAEEAARNAQRIGETVPQAPPGYTPAELRDSAAARLRAQSGVDLSFNHYNFAICGQSGTGKSTLINALRGLRPGDPDAARTAAVECTMDIRRYNMPGVEHIKIWDLPGCGTVAHPVATYFEDKCLAAFDAVVLVMGRTVFAADVELYRILRRCVPEMNVLVVRNQIDNAYNAKRRERGVPRAPRTIEDELPVMETVRAVREEIAPYIQQQFGNPLPPYYLVSAASMFDRDEPFYEHPRWDLFNEVDLFRDIAAAPRRG